MQGLTARWTLKWRLVALFAAFAMAEMITTTAIQFFNAQEFVEEELRAAVQQAALLATHVVGREADVAADHAAALGHIKADLDGISLRHARIELLDRNGAPVIQTRLDEEPWAAPGWFVALLDPAPQQWRYDGALGTVVVTGEPHHEIAETWENLVAVTGLVLVLNAAMMLVVYVLVSRLVRPLQAFEAGLKRLEQGAYDISFDPGDLPELIRIGTRITALRDSLRHLEIENHRLARQLITVQDEERNGLSHEIHDGLGPYLFSIRVDAQGLVGAAESHTLSADDVAARGTAILQAADRVQAMTRGMLKRLRPMALDHMQLAEVLADMVETWRRQTPDMDWQLSIGDGLDGLDETTNVTLYHTVKEAGLNVIRHAEADAVWITVRRLPMSQGGPLDLIEIQVNDDGKGVGADKVDGIGLAGMRERVRALGGIISIGPRPGGGTRLLAGIPVAARTQSEARTHD